MHLRMPQQPPRITIAFQLEYVQTVQPSFHIHHPGPQQNVFGPIQFNHLHTVALHRLKTTTQDSSNSTTWVNAPNLYLSHSMMKIKSLSRMSFICGRLHISRIQEFVSLSETTATKASPNLRPCLLKLPMSTLLYTTSTNLLIFTRWPIYASKRVLYSNKGHWHFSIHAPTVDLCALCASASPDFNVDLIASLNHHSVFFPSNG